jgi:hypothetical protein
MLLDIGLIVLGTFISGIALFSAVRTFVLSRAVTDPVVAFVFIFFRVIFEGVSKFFPKYRQRDRIMALYAPIVLISLPPVWLLLISVGYTMIYYALGVSNWSQAFTLSGSSLLTLGFAKNVYAFPVLEFSQAVIGPLLIALLIAYLPTMYSAFQSREKAVNLLTVRAGSPPSPVQMLLRFHRLDRLENLSSFWEQWETWFVELEESHTSLSALVFFRSPQPDHSWVNAAGAVLDAASLRLALLDLPGDAAPTVLPDGSEIPSDAQAAITIRAGYIALNRIADHFNLPYVPDPHFPGNSISITREEFDQAIEILSQQGMPLRPDHQKAWIDFGGWRVNYDSALQSLHKLTMAPPSSWLGDS